MLQVGCVARSEKHVNQITQHKDFFNVYYICSLLIIIV